MTLSDVPPLPKFTEARRQRIYAVVDSMNISPTAINVPMSILALQRSKAAGLSEFGQALTCDPALASKVLATVNSSFFSPPKPVTKVTEAVRMIGLNNLLPLVFGLSMAGIFNPAELPPSDRSALWRTALLKGLIARERARMLGAANVIEEAFLCGLFQDIALPAMLVADRAAALELTFMLDAEDRPEREHALFGTDHCEVGARLLTRFGLPPLYIEMVQHHHDETELENPTILTLANRLAAAAPHRIIRADGYRGDKIRRCFIRNEPDSNPTPNANANARFYTFLAEVNSKYETLCGHLGDSDEGSTAFKVFLQQVCEQIAQSMTAAIGEASQTITQLNDTTNSLQTKLSEMESQVQAGDIDPLTEAFNRRGFDKRATKVFELAREYQWGVLVGFIDLDNFKKINDQHGHEGGDAALRALATALREAVKKQGVIGRCGGDEFVLSATCAADQKQALCSALEAAMSGLKFPLANGESLPLTTSCGLTWIETLAPGDTVGTALKRADELMYDAKRAGKARCVISPLKAA